MSRSPFETFVWHSDIFNCSSTDIHRFYSLLEQERNRLSLSATKLADAAGYPIWLMQSPQRHPERPNLLISTGFHGEESAGPWGLLYLLAQLDERMFKRANLSLLQLVNPTGFANGHRFNELGENPNRGFISKTISLKWVMTPHLKAKCYWKMPLCSLS